MTVLVRFRRDLAGPWLATIRVPTDDFGAVMELANRHFGDHPPRQLGGPSLPPPEKKR